MAPLLCSPVTDTYGSTFGLTPEQLAQLNLKNNQKCANDNIKYQKNLLDKEISGKSNFSETKPAIPPVVQTVSNNNTNEARRLGYTNVSNEWPSNQGFSMFNRFQNAFGNKEYFSSTTDSDCLQTIVKLMKELLLIAKIIMFILVLFFLIKILKNKN